MRATDTRFLLFGASTCLLAENVDPPCQYHNAIFPPDGLEYFVLECLGPGVPIVSLYKTEMPAPRLITMLQSNTLLRVSHLRVNRLIATIRSFVSDAI